MKNFKEIVFEKVGRWIIGIRSHSAGGYISGNDQQRIFGKKEVETCAECRHDNTYKTMTKTCLKLDLVLSGDTKACNNSEPKTCGNCGNTIEMNTRGVNQSGNVKILACSINYLYMCKSFSCEFNPSKWKKKEGSDD